MTVHRLQPYAVTVFAEMSALAARIGAVNLGQGFPDEDGPARMLKSPRTPSPRASTSTRPGWASRRCARRSPPSGCAATASSTTVGATEAIAASLLGPVEPGSEVLVIEPFYDSYAPVVAMAGCQRVAVPLVPDGGGFALDADALRAAITPTPVH